MSRQKLFPWMANVLEIDAGSGVYTAKWEDESYTKEVAAFEAHEGLTIRLVIGPPRKRPGKTFTVKKRLAEYYKLERQKTKTDK